MSRWSLLFFVALVLLPLVLMAGVGGWVLWTSGHWTWLKWAIPICWTAAWLVARFAKRIDVPTLQIGSKIHWTPQDHAAASIIETEQKRIAEFTGQQLTDPRFYTDRTIELATSFAKHYHPKATDPLGSASLIEILAAISLVTEDLETMLRENVPGSHLITVSQWQSLANAPTWWRMASNLGWILSTIADPTALGRYAVSKAFVNPVVNQLQTNSLATFYMLFVRQLGFYLIELNSGRLRGGSDRYRDVMKSLKSTTSDAPNVPAKTEPVTVTIAVIGQVKAGKSSLVNCLLGQQQAAVDILPLTYAVQRYDLHLNDQSDRLILLDTPGYSDSGATREQLQETFEAVRNADLVLLVLDVRSPAKQADMSTLERLEEWFREQRRLKPPSIVGVISKIDGLSPIMEWEPPYSFEHPVRPKELNLKAAMDFTKTTFGERLVSLVPVCTDREHGRIFGIEEFLLPTISLLLDEARACSLVRALHRDYDQQRARQVVSQLISVGAKIKDYAPQFAKSQLGQVAQTIINQLTKK